MKAAAAQGATITSLDRLLADLQHARQRARTRATASTATSIRISPASAAIRKFVRETFDGRYYRPLTDDFIGLVRLQAGQINGSAARTRSPSINNFNLGPTLVRGFAPGGIGPRDISDPVEPRGERSRRHDLCRRHARGSVPDLRPAEGNRAEAARSSPTRARCSVITGRRTSRTCSATPSARPPP